VSAIFFIETSFLGLNRLAAKMKKDALKKVKPGLGLLFSF